MIPQFIFSCRVRMTDSSLLECSVVRSVVRERDIADLAGYIIKASGYGALSAPAVQSQNTEFWTRTGRLL